MIISLSFTMYMNAYGMQCERYWSLMQNLVSSVHINKSVWCAFLLLYVSFLSFFLFHFGFGFYVKFLKISNMYEHVWSLWFCMDTQFTIGWNELWALKMNCWLRNYCYYFLENLYSQSYDLTKRKITHHLRVIKQNPYFLQI